MSRHYLLLILLCMGCSFAVTNNIIEVRRANPVFNITLASNPTTGFSWKLSHYDKQVIQLISHLFKAPNTKLIGAQGQEVWKFKVNRSAFFRKNHTNITMEYARPWEKGRGYKTVRTFDIRLKK